MKTALKRIAKFYYNSWWLAAVILGVLGLLCVATIVLPYYNVIFPTLCSDSKPVPFLGWVHQPIHKFWLVKGLLILFGFGFVAVFVNHLGNRRWGKAFYGVLLLVGIYFLHVVVVIMVAIPVLAKICEIVQIINAPVEQVETQPAEEPPTEGNAP